MEKRKARKVKVRSADVILQEVCHKLREDGYIFSYVTLINAIDQKAFKVFELGVVKKVYKYTIFCSMVDGGPHVRIIKIGECHYLMHDESHL